MLLRPRRLHRDLAERPASAAPVRGAYRPHAARDRNRRGRTGRRQRSGGAHGDLLRPTGTIARRHHQRPRPARHRAGRRPVAHDAALSARA